LHNDVASTQGGVDAAPVESIQDADQATVTSAEPAPTKPRKPREAKRSAVAPRSHIIVRSKKQPRPVRRPCCDSNPLTLPPLVWTAVAEKHLQFRLAAPCA
jgi:hypothetical protein